MKFFLITVTLMIAFSAQSQPGIPISKDTLIFHSEAIRNNLAGQQVIIKNNAGTLFRMGQDGMPCWAPKPAEGAIIPNSIALKPGLLTNTATPAIPQKKGLPE